MSMNRNAFLLIAGFFLSIVLLLIGILLLRKDLLVWGFGSLLVAAAIFVALLVMSEGKSLNAEDGERLKPLIIPAGLFFTSIVIMVYVIDTLSLWTRTGAQNRWITVGWVTSMLCCVAGMLWATRGHLKWKWGKEWFSSHRGKLWILATILLFSLAFRTYLLTDHPFPWSGDEASVGIEGRRILAGEVTDFFDAGWSGQPNWSFIPTTISEILLGQTIVAIRIVSALEGTLAVLGLFLLARELFDFRIAALAAGFLAAFPYHLQFSRIGVNNVIDSMIVCFVLWLVFRAVRTGQASSYLWAGIASGLTFYTYVGSRLVMALAFLVLLFAILRQRGYLRSHLPQLGVFLFGFVIAIAPMITYFIRHPDIFMTRIGQESIFINGWIYHQAQNTGNSIVAILWKQFTDTTLVYISKNAIGNFFNYPGPYLTMVGAIFFLLGMVFSLTRILQPRMFALQAWFWSVIFLGGVFTLSPPANTRLIMTAPAVALFLALGVNLLAELVNQLKITGPATQEIVCGLIVLFLGIQNLSTYFGSYRLNNYFEDATGEFTQAIGLELQQLGPDYDYYLIGLPRIFAAFPTVVFLAPGSGMYDVSSDSINGLSVIPGRSNIFVAIPENRSDLERLAAAHPGGAWEQVNRRYKAEVLYYAYLVH